MELRKLEQEKKEDEERKKAMEDANKKEPEHNNDGMVPESEDHPKTGAVRPPPVDASAEIREAHNLYIQKLTNPFTQIDELRAMFYQPIPQNVGFI